MGQQLLRGKVRDGLARWQINTAAGRAGLTLVAVLAQEQLQGQSQKRAGAGKAEQQMKPLQPCNEAAPEAQGAQYKGCWCRAVLRCPLFAPMRQPTRQSPSCTLSPPGNRP